MKKTTKILGWDAARNSKDNGFCLLTISERNILVEIKEWDIDDPSISEEFESLDFICVDIPLGWPIAFQREWENGHPPANQFSDDGFDRTFKRATDRFIKATTKTQVLEVGAEKIARASVQTIHRLNSLVPNWREHTAVHTIDMNLNHTQVLEVYPRATIENIRLQKAYPEKKTKNGMISRSYVEKVLTDISNQQILLFWPPSMLDEFEQADNLVNGHQFDAFIAAITGLMIFQGHEDYSFFGCMDIKMVMDRVNTSDYIQKKGYIDYIKENDLQSAYLEGWIWVPFKKLP
ncbi:MAG: DUF429 domain-containing protein [Oceanospirillaceae bacterium]|nr:DUF429 domain-containing protein [Oceanospirillaceae bacterium]